MKIAANRDSSDSTGRFDNARLLLARSLISWRCSLKSIIRVASYLYFFFFQAEDGIRDYKVTGVQTCALPIFLNGTSFTIVGVAPPEFFGVRVRRSPDFWIPLVFQPQIEMRQSFLNDPRVLDRKSVV